MRNRAPTTAGARAIRTIFFLAAIGLALALCLSPLAARQQRPARDRAGQVRDRAQLRQPAGSAGQVPQVLRKTDHAPEDAAHDQRLHDAIVKDLPYVPGELLVRFREEASVERRARALRAAGTGADTPGAKWIGDVLYLRDEAIGDPEAAAVALGRQPDVLYAEPNYLRRLHSTPNDPMYSSQKWNFEAINVPQAWDINAGVAGQQSPVTVAVIDTGLTTTTATYSMRIWNGYQFRSYDVPFAKTLDFDHARVLPGRDFVERWEWVFDADSHGTHVAGTIAQQTNNALGYAGIASFVSILPVKVCEGYWDLQLAWGYESYPGIVPRTYEGGCATADVIAGVRWAVDNGAKVLNISLGSESMSNSERDALEYAVQNGAFVSISGGNEGDKGNTVHYPAAFAPQIEGVVAVAAINSNMQRATYSTSGSHIELAAPGGDSAARIWQIVPNISDLSPYLSSPRFDRYQGGGTYGTSMAAPHVAAVAAMLHARGVRSPAAIEAILKLTAKDLGPAGRDNEYGNGLIDARAALRGMGVAK